MGDPSDLIRRAKDGDREAIEVLLGQYRELLKRLADNGLGPAVTARVDASDVVQKTLLQAYSGLPDFRGEQPPEFAAWLRSIMEMNVAQAVRDNVYIQKRSVNRERSMDDSKAGMPLRESLDSETTTPSLKIAQAEESDRLHRAIKQLPEDQAEAVRLRHLQGWSLIEIARHMERTPTAAAGLLKRGMQKLKSILGQE